jgi:hypothetical protein
MVLLSAPALRLSDDGRFGGAAIQRFGRRGARRRALAERFGGVGGELAERLLGVSGIGLDRFRKLLEPGVEQIGGGAAAHFDLLGDGFGAADQQLLQWPMRLSSVLATSQRFAPSDLSCRFRRGARRCRLGRVSELRAARVSKQVIGQYWRDVGDALVERGDDFSAAFGQRLGDIHDAADSASVSVCVRLSSASWKRDRRWSRRW